MIQLRCPSRVASCYPVSMDAFYGEDLAFVHVDGFEAQAASAAETLLKHVGQAAPSQRVLDLGCGAGPLSRRLAERGFFTWGLDVSPALIALARARLPDADFQCGSIVDVPLPSAVAAAAVGDPLDILRSVNYCDICNPFSYAKSIMGDPAQRAAHIKDAIDFFQALDQGNLPSVVYVKPDSIVDGHPASSTLDLFEAMTENIVDKLKHHPELFKDTALFVTFDEGGGYWDSGFFAPLDFFGDGPRIPLVVVSPYSRGGKVVHSYNDHASVVKFIERNWHLNPLTNRSRDNLPNPQMQDDNPYVPRNIPAVGDLFDMFDFH